MKNLPPNTRKIVTGFVGWLVLLVGIVLIPYPGPGWVIVFIGLSLLAREFEWAKNLHDYAHSKYVAWQNWLKDQPRSVKLLFWALTAALVVSTVWLLNGYGLINGWFNLGFDWAQSPFVR
jgi:uncharacterized protein (TIGR02611 family)